MTETRERPIEARGASAEAAAGLTSSATTARPEPRQPNHGPAHRRRGSRRRDPRRHRHRESAQGAGRRVRVRHRRLSDLRRRVGDPEGRDPVLRLPQRAGGELRRRRRRLPHRTTGRVRHGLGPRDDPRPRRARQRARSTAGRCSCSRARARPTSKARARSRSARRSTPPGSSASTRRGPTACAGFRSTSSRPCARPSTAVPAPPTSTYPAIRSTARSIAEKLFVPPRCPDATRPSAEAASVERAVALLRTAERPLVIIGKGAAYSRAEDELRTFIERTQLPFLPTPMGKGVVSDDHPLCTRAGALVRARQRRRRAAGRRAPQLDPPLRPAAALRHRRQDPPDRHRGRGDRQQRADRGGDGGRRQARDAADPRGARRRAVRARSGQRVAARPGRVRRQERGRGRRR